ncbi:MAG: penicillin-binding protein 2 [Anaerolineae bacterium]|nr:penicillin-binding protein 2 [Anaerolineae bacterium]
MTRWLSDDAFRRARRRPQTREVTEQGASRPSWFLQSPRIALLGWGVLLILGLYMIRLWQLQFLERGAWEARAQEQQSRLVILSPPRGVIYDRNGEILVRNVPAYNVTITPGELPDDPEREREVLMRLAAMLEVPYSTEEGFDRPEYRGEINAIGRGDFPPFGDEPEPGLLEMVDNVRWLEPFAPIVVDENIERDLALLIAQEGGVTMPGVGIEIISRRRYTNGELTSQILGFLGPIPRDSVETYEQKGYNAAVDRIGYAGVEAQYEELLRGIPGRKMVERDVLGQELGVLSETAPTPGDNLYLTLDVRLQAVATEALAQGLEEAGSRRGAAVVLDPRDGQLLALVSLPTYDNNMFSKKLDEDAYEALLKDQHHPFLNHAISDQIPPGSTFKIVPATAGLQEGVINRFTTLNCPGRMLLPNKFAPADPSLAQPFYCWIQLQNGHGHGPLSVVDALAQSCDIFFYQVGGGLEETSFEGLGVDRLAAYSTQFGLGAQTGIDIPGEAAGLVPTPQWKRQNYQETWTTGNTYNFAIGQGDLLVTPLQMANALAAVANGGTLYRPQFVHHIQEADGNVIRGFAPVVSHTLGIDEAVWQVVREGLDLAVSETGTGNRALLDEISINLAGKTGTAEYCDDIALEAGRCDVDEDEVLPTHAWFMAYGPTEAPEIVVVVWIYDGGEGSVASAPVAKEILDFYFRRELGLLGVEEEAPEGEAPESEAPEGEGAVPVDEMLPAPVEPPLDEQVAPDIEAPAEGQAAPDAEVPVTPDAQPEVVEPLPGDQPAP